MEIHSKPSIDKLACIVRAVCIFQRAGQLCKIVYKPVNVGGCPLGTTGVLSSVRCTWRTKRCTPFGVRYLVSSSRNKVFEIIFIKRDGHATTVAILYANGIHPRQNFNLFCVNIDLRIVLICP